MNSVLTINGGSSSIKFALFQTGEPLKRILYGKIDRIGLSGTNLTFHDAKGKPQPSHKLKSGDHKSAANFLIDWLEEHADFATVKAIGHRVVHGMKHTAPELVTKELIAELHRISPCDPDHLPGEIELIETFQKRHPKLPQIVCFDTAFHQTMPRVATLLPIPRRFEARGIQRYGFHGLSYAYLMEELARLGDPAAAHGRVILAHLGNGASLAAVRDGKSIDTSMGFTPTAGLVMSTRSGDLDPGLLSYLSRTEKMTVPQFQKMVNHESGLLGISETSSDMRDLSARAAKDVRAAEAVEIFCYQARKWIGSFAAALGGLDTLVFAGGIGENAPQVRKRICEELGFLGIKLDKTRNKRNAAILSANAGRVKVRLIRTDEELMIARSVCRTIDLADPSPLIMTIGHSTHPIAEFIHLLQSHGGTCVVDVRTIPRSRHNPQFNQITLSRSLKKAGLKYVHMPGLGGLRHAKRDSINAGWRNTSFRGYADYMQTPEFAQSLEQLIHLSATEKMVLMCAEAVPWRCHRSLIADALLVRGIRVEDILTPTRRQVHVLTSFAKVQGATITYPEISGNPPKKLSKKRPKPFAAKIPS